MQSKEFLLFSEKFPISYFSISDLEKWTKFGLNIILKVPFPIRNPLKFKLSHLTCCFAAAEILPNLLGSVPLASASHCLPITVPHWWTSLGSLAVWLLGRRIACTLQVWPFSCGATVASCHRQSLGLVGAQFFLSILNSCLSQLPILGPQCSLFSGLAIARWG